MVTTRIFWTCVFALSFALVEAAVVVYLRAIYYPEGFTFPLSIIRWDHASVEIARESATFVMLGCVAVLAGRTTWQRVGFFLIGFAVWDVFYYIWLKVFLDWPGSILEWDVLFLMPIPWISPVLAPVLISATLLSAGLVIIIHEERSPTFRVRWGEALISVVATLVLLYTFMADTEATLHQAEPRPYNYVLFAIGMAGYAFLLVRFWKRIPKAPQATPTQSTGGPS